MSLVRSKQGALLALLPLLLLGCKEAAKEAPATPVAAEDPAAVHPEIWPSVTWPFAKDPALEEKVAALLKKMTVEEKVGQVVQGDICCIKPEDMKKYHLGSILAGGGSAPGNNERAPAKEWLALADEFYAASIDTSNGGAGIPMIWGIDAMHGHSNIVGAVLFPHNVGLGATHNPKLLGEIARVTAEQVRTTGIDWTFAPTVTVPQDDRWGRAYEGYSEDPNLVASYAGVFVKGLQGDPSAPDFLRGKYVISSTKHFLADGGTENGRDQGDAKIPETELRDIHNAGYVPAIEAGVQTIMISFSSWNGKKLSGNKGLMTDVLKKRMNFDGFTVGDWNAHGQVEGCTNDNCPQAFNAGLDMFMAPDSWRGLYDNTLKQVKDGTISMERLDEAVTRILRVKFRAGVFDGVAPSKRPLGGDFKMLSSPEQRALARDAVRQSLVLLKNNGGLLPLAANKHVLVTGDGADNISKQSGGWTVTWQGTGLNNADFPGGTSVWGGVKAAVKAGGGTAEDRGDLLLVAGRGHDDGGRELEVADQFALERDAGRELGIERDADEAVVAGLDEDAVDPQPRGPEAARDLRLRQALHEIEPGRTDVGLVLGGRHVAGSRWRRVVGDASGGSLVRPRCICKQRFTFASAVSDVQPSASEVTAGTTRAS